MADILRFVPKPLPPLNDAGEQFSVNGPAEIIIFPGIRVERKQFRLSDRIEKEKPVRVRSKRGRPKRNEK